jgi:hypothetical protein
METLKTLVQSDNFLEFFVGLTNFGNVEELNAALTNDGEPLNEEDQLKLIKDSSVEVRKAVNDNGFKKGQKEAFKALKKQIREELGEEASIIDVGFIKTYSEKAKAAAIAEFKANNPDKKLSELDPKEVQKLAISQDWYKNNISALVKERDEARNKAANAVKEFEQRLVLGKVEKEALAKFNALKVPISQDETRRTNQINNFLNLVKMSGEFKADGEKIQVLEDGIPVTIDYNPATFDQWLSNLINSNYDVPPIDPSKSSPNGKTVIPSSSGQDNKPDYSLMTMNDAYKHALSLKGEDRTKALESFKEAEKAGSFKQPE